MDDKNRPFVTESVRKKPINKRKLFRRTALTVVMAVVFGAIACLTFLLMEPIIGKVINPEKVLKVSFPEEEVPVEQLLTEESKAQKEQDEQQAVLEEAKEEIVREMAQDVIQEEEEEEPLTNYIQTYDELSNIARTAQSYMVTVVSSTQIENWLRGSYEEEKSFSGMIVADNSQSYLILADLQGQQGSRYTIRFNDDTFIEKEIQRYDPQTGLAVFAVEKSSLSEETREKISPAVLGNSTSAGMVGKPVIAVGSPQGISDSIAYGIVTSNNALLQVTDANYSVMLTDLSGVTNASGALLNLNGDVIGVILQKAQSLSPSGGIAVVGISELKGLIAKLSNDEGWGYLGVSGMGVTSQVHGQMDLPFGAFVAEVEPGSPAMQAGIQNGDIIVKIQNTEISSFREIKTALLMTSPGENVRVELMRNDGIEYQSLEVEALLTESP